MGDPMDELSEAELKSLRAIVAGVQPPGAIPAEHARRLIELEFVEQRRSGLIATGKGRMRAKTAKATAP